MPAQAGIHATFRKLVFEVTWVPAFAGMTSVATSRARGRFRAQQTSAIGTGELRPKERHWLGTLGEIQPCHCSEVRRCKEYAAGS
jgi:hypothetical protein